jgi:uncharacterized membrane protein YdbT with pleckstrin-like domain
MSYVEKNLISGEELIYETGIHWSALILPVVYALVSATAGVAASYWWSDLKIVGAIFFAIAAIIIVYAILKRNATEMAVTNRRVIIKTGITSRRSLEIMLAKVESIGIDEPTWGRILGYGSVTIHGTGGTPEPFHRIAHPAEFRREVQQQIDEQKA